MSAVKPSGEQVGEEVVRPWRNLTANHKLTVFDDEREKQARAPFYFIQTADIQFGFIQGYLEKNPEPGWSKEIALAEQAVECVNRMRPRPRFVVMCGDMCHAYPGEEPELRRLQEADYKRIFGRLDANIPLVCVCGNHDVGNTPTPETVESYRSSFGEDYFAFWCGGVFFIVINSQYFYDDSLVGELSREQEAWLDRALEELRSSGRRGVVFQHIPWFVRDPSETDTGYFALPVSRRLPALEKLRAAGVTHVFSGHLHRNAGGRFHDLEMVVTSAVGGQLGEDQSGLRVVQCREEGIRHQYYSLDSMPKTVDLSDK